MESEMSDFSQYEADFPETSAQWWRERSRRVPIVLKKEYGDMVKALEANENSAGSFENRNVLTAIDNTINVIKHGKTHLSPKLPGNMKVPVPANRNFNPKPYAMINQVGIKTGGNLSQNCPRLLQALEKLKVALDPYGNTPEAYRV
ncbi:MAG: hypothetical protein V2J10_01870 [Wenzhouxiangella sp.]|nr:hypothetical protein [Wenzhouxiangella sp.]